MGVVWVDNKMISIYFNKFVTLERIFFSDNNMRIYFIVIYLWVYKSSPTVGKMKSGILTLRDVETQNLASLRNSQKVFL